MESASNPWSWLLLLAAITIILILCVALYAAVRRRVVAGAAGLAAQAAGAAVRGQPAPAAAPAPAGGRAWNQVPWTTIALIALAVVAAGAAFWLFGGLDGLTKPEINGWWVLAILGAAALLVVAVTKPDKFGSLLVWILFGGLALWALFGYLGIQDARVGAPNGVRPTMEVAGAGGGSPPSAPAADRAADDRAIQASRLARIAEIEAKRYDATLEPGERQVRLPIEPGGYVLKYVPPIGVSVIAKCWTGSNDPPADAVFEPCGPNTIATWQILELEEPQAEPVTIRWWFEKVTG